MQHHGMMTRISASNNAAEMYFGFSRFGPSSYPLPVPLSEPQALESTTRPTGSYNSEPGLSWTRNGFDINAISHQDLAQLQNMEDSGTLEGVTSTLDHRQNWPSYPHTIAGVHFQSQRPTNMEESTGLWELPSRADSQDSTGRASNWEFGQLYGEYYTHFLEKIYSSYLGYSNGTLEEHMPLRNSLPYSSHSTAIHEQAAMHHRCDLAGKSSSRRTSSRQSLTTQAIPNVPCAGKDEPLYVERKPSGQIDLNGTHTDKVDSEILGDKSVTFSKRGRRRRAVNCGTRREKDLNRNAHNRLHNKEDFQAQQAAQGLDTVENLHLVSTTTQFENLSLQLLQTFSKAQETNPKQQDKPENYVNTVHKPQSIKAIQRDKIGNPPQTPKVPEETLKPLREQDSAHLQHLQEIRTGIGENLLSLATEQPGLQINNAGQISRTACDSESGNRFFDPVQQILHNATSNANAGYKQGTKKNKAEDVLSPCGAAAAEPRSETRNSRPAEMYWAMATNCLPEKDEEENGLEDFEAESEEWARERLKLTTQLMQNLVPPLPATMMQASSVEGLVCGVYTLARLSLGEACKMVHGSCIHHLPTSKNLEANCSLTRRMDGTLKLRTFEDSKDLSALLCKELVKEKINQLDKSLLRITESTLDLEVVTRGVEKLEKLGITNRLVKHHCKELFMDVKRVAPDAESRSILQRSSLQKYVRAVRMPKKVPQGIQCLRL